MALAFALKTNNGSVTDATSYATDAFTPVANRRYLIAISNSAASPATPVPTQPDMAIAAIAGATATSGTHKLTLFEATADASISGANAMTIDFSGATQTGCDWSVVEVTGEDAGTWFGTPATNTTAGGTTLTVTMGAFGAASNIR